MQLIFCSSPIGRVRTKFISHGKKIISCKGKNFYFPRGKNFVVVNQQGKNENSIPPGPLNN